ncbi:MULTISPECIES: hypothetical protein [unclassified Haladaptatus]|uniref:DUF7535 family protein n=1 Tax=unclassified Haladaptatus TaxID=2622732 RepID=UPI0023E7C589|nr:MULTISPECIES: hypothetical protein [unclassified Haladaptatus]
MSDSETAQQETPVLSDDLKSVYRTVTEPMGMHGNNEMSLLGLIWFGLLVVLLIPLAPFIALVWVIGYLRERLLSTEEVDLQVRDQIRARERARRRQGRPG